MWNAAHVTAQSPDWHFLLQALCVSISEASGICHIWCIDTLYLPPLHITPPWQFHQRVLCCFICSCFLLHWFRNQSSSAGNPHHCTAPQATWHCEFCVVILLSVFFFRDSHVWHGADVQHIHPDWQHGHLQWGAAQWWQQVSFISVLMHEVSCALLFQQGKITEMGESHFWSEKDTYQGTYQAVWSHQPHQAVYTIVCYADWVSLATSLVPTQQELPTPKALTWMRMTKQVMTHVGCSAFSHQKRSKN